MNIKKFVSWIVAAALVFSYSPLFAQEKKDVTDPVLREMINSLSTKMPRFINKYGANVFVEDEPITRGSLVAAFYEYNKNSQSAAPAVQHASSDVTRQEFDALKSKVASISSSGGSSKSSGGRIDTITLISELEPNMPVLLDNTLKSSKVFRELQQQVYANSKSGSSGGSYSGDSELSAKVAYLSRKVERLEAANPNARLTTSSSSSSDSSGAGRIAAISLGITMIAALFVAR